MITLLAAALAGAAPVPVGGDGPYRVVMETPASFPGYTVYRPANPAAVARSRPLAVVAWANGGCVNAGNYNAALLGEIASHGYLVIALGPITRVDHAAPPRQAAPPSQTLAKLVEQSRHTAPPTSFDQLSRAVTWAEQQSRLAPWRGRIDPSRVAFAGHSCGGLEAIAGSAADQRVKTTVMLNSGIFEQPMVPVDKTALDRLHAPIAYFIGGADDMSHANAEDDFARITRVPVLKAVNGYGHGGRLQEALGGPTAPWVIRWLDWQLKGDQAAARSFTGPDCGICRAPGLTVSRKGID